MILNWRVLPPLEGECLYFSLVLVEVYASDCTYIRSMLLW